MAEERQPESNQPSTTEFALPPNVYQTLARQRLGLPTAVYDSTTSSRFPVGCIVTLCGVPALYGLVLLIEGVLTHRPGVVAIGFACVLLLLLGFLLLMRWRSRPNRQVKRVVVCPGGLALLRDNGEIVALAWDQITAITRSITTSETEGPHISGYRIDAPAISPYQFSTHEFARVGAQKGLFVQLGHLLEQEFVVRRLPHALAAYHTGVPVVFGPLSLSTAGISFGAEKLSWSGVSQIEITETTLTIKQHPANIPWYQASAGDLPNLALLEGLTEIIRRGQP